MRHVELIINSIVIIHLPRRMNQLNMLIEAIYIILKVFLSNVDPIPSLSKHSILDDLKGLIERKLRSDSIAQDSTAMQNDRSTPTIMALQTSVVVVFFSSLGMSRIVLV